MNWDKDYERDKLIWGEQPSELALFTASYLKTTDIAGSSFIMVDLGCGYGRDAVYFCSKFNCSILGVDKAPEAIRMARSNTKNKASVQFQCADFFSLPPEAGYDVVYASNLYQLLKPGERERFREIVRIMLKPQAYFFMSTHSASDPEHAGKGTPVAADPNSFIDQKYLHLCDEAELRRDFSFLDIKALHEHRYDEPRSTGEVHHHISWLLAGKLEK
jgi:SAM-dependent methyltransferase